MGWQSFIGQTFGMKISAEQISQIRNITAMAKYVADHKTRIEIEKTDWHSTLTMESHSTLPTIGKDYDGITLATKEAIAKLL